MGKIIIALDNGFGVMSEELNTSGLWIIIAVSVLAWLAFYLLRSIGIYKLCVKNGVEKPYLAWIPAFWIYPCCKLIGEQRFFGKSYSKIALVVAIIFSVATVLNLVITFIDYFPLVGYYLNGGTIYLGSSEEVAVINPNAGEYWNLGEIFVDNNFKYPYNRPNLVYNLSGALTLFGAFLDIATIVVEINMYIVLFRKFWPQHYVVASVMSFFGLFPVFVFVIRNKTAVVITRTYYNGNPYAGNPYGYNGSYQQPRPRNDEPFGEFNNKDDEPFGDIFNKKRDGDDN